MNEPKHPEVNVPMVGHDGNPMAIVGRARNAAREAGVSRDAIKQFTDEALSGDYDNVIQTVIRWFSVDVSRPDEGGVDGLEEEDECMNCGEYLSFDGLCDDCDGEED